MLSIGLLLLSLLLACNDNKQVPEPAVREATRRVEGPSKELSAVDSLLWQRPDSALVCLLPYFDTCRDGVHTVSTTDYDRHYANLLLSELLYKNDYTQTNRPALRQAVAYFDSLTLTINSRSHAFCRHCGLDPQSPTQQDIIAFLDARAHYINGVGYYEHDSVVEACKEYMKALEVMEEHFEEEELVGKKAKFMALTYTHLTSLFSDMYLHEQAIYFGKVSLHYYYKYEASPMHIAWVLDEIGLHYDILENYDSAYFHYNQGLKILSDTNSLTYRDIVTHLACLSYKEGGDAAKSLSQLHILINIVNWDKEYYSRCLSIGEIFYQEKQYDSAWFYYHKVFDFTQSEESKRLAAERLIEICKVQGKEPETSEYVDFLIPFANQEEIKSAVKSQLTELYKSFDQRRLEQLHRHEKKKNLKWTIGISIGFIAMLSVIVILYRKNKRKRQLLEIQIKEEQLTHTIQQKSLSGRLKQKNQEMRKLQDQIKQQNDSDAETEPTISFVEEPVCRLIMERVKEGKFKSQMDCTIYKNYALTKDQIMALHKAVNLHFDGFAVRLKKAYPQLTDSDLNYCSLYLLGLTDADIAALMQKAYPTVSQRSRKLKTIFGSETSLPITLHNFANNNLSY
jgi:tetratricopeptide (TPR) repeat protein